MTGQRELWEVTERDHLRTAAGATVRVHVPLGELDRAELLAVIEALVQERNFAYEMLATCSRGWSRALMPDG